MKKAVLFLIMFFAICIGPSYSYTLKGEVTYTVERARKEAFANVEYSLPQSIIDKNIKDPNFKENIKAIKLGATELKDRYIQHYSDGGYAIVYKKNPHYVHYYSQTGELTSIEKRKSLQTPTSSLSYTPQGQLDGVTFILSPDNMYLFDVKGKFVCHWVGDKAYDKNGKVILTRY